MKRKGSLTPKCKLFYSEALRLKKNFLRCHSANSSFKQRLQFATQFPDELIMNKIALKITPVLLLFSNLQLRETKKKSRGRRFTLNEKMLSLSSFKKSPKSYKLLSKLFTLPSSRTLNSLLSTVKLKAGINTNLMKMITENVKKLPLKSRYCVLMFDKVSLSPELQYNSSTGIIHGFEDNGSSRTRNLSDHALVFLVKGIYKNFKQPIAYTFCKSYVRYKYIFFLCFRYKYT